MCNGRRTRRVRRTMAIADATTVRESSRISAIGWTTLLIGSGSTDGRGRRLFGQSRRASGALRQSSYFPIRHSWPVADVLALAGTGLVSRLEMNLPCRRSWASIMVVSVRSAPCLSLTLSFTIRYIPRIHLVGPADHDRNRRRRLGTGQGFHGALIVHPEPRRSVLARLLQQARHWPLDGRREDRGARDEPQLRERDVRAEER